MIRAFSENFPASFSRTIVTPVMRMIGLRGFFVWATGLLAVTAVGDARAQAEGTRKGAFGLGTNGVTVSSPAIGADGSIFIGVETRGGGRVLAVNPSDFSRPKWVRELTRFVQSSPAVGADGTVYIGGGDGKLYALNPVNGDSRWECDLKTPLSSSPAVGVDGTIYIGGSLDSKLHAVWPNGTERWAFPTGGVVTSSPTIGPDGAVYVGSWDRMVYAVTPEGTRKWQFETAGIVHSSPAVGKDGAIYVGSEDQTVYAITPEGGLKWKKFTNGLIQSSPSIGADGTIYIASNDANFYALSPDDGSERWVKYLGTTTASTAAVRGDGVIIVGGDDGIVHALKPNGTVAWEFSTLTQDNAIESSPVVAPDGTIYFGCLDGRLYAVYGNGSPLSAYSPWPSFRRDMMHNARMPAATREGQLANIATRARAGGGNHLIAGFVVQGATGTPYLLRAIGPGLASQNLVGFLRDPALELFVGQVPVRFNDNWPLNDPVSGSGLIDTFKGVGAFELPTDSKDAAMVQVLSTGVFTASVTSTDATSGVALVEVYDALGGDRNARLINLSTRGQVGSGDNVMIAGFVVRDGPMRLLLRGVGPGLAQFVGPGTLTRSRIEVFSGGTPLRANVGWTSDGFVNDLTVASASVSAFPLQPGSADSALVFDASPGPYTIIVSGVGGSTGEALVEIYVLH